MGVAEGDENARAECICTAHEGRESVCTVVPIVISSFACVSFLSVFFLSRVAPPIPPTPTPQCGRAVCGGAVGGWGVPVRCPGGGESTSACLSPCSWMLALLLCLLSSSSSRSTANPPRHAPATDHHHHVALLRAHPRAVSRGLAVPCSVRGVVSPPPISFPLIPRAMGCPIRTPRQNTKPQRTGHLKSPLRGPPRQPPPWGSPPGVAVGPAWATKTPQRKLSHTATARRRIMRGRAPLQKPFQFPFLGQSPTTPAHPRRSPQRSIEKTRVSRPTPSIRPRWVAKHIRRQQRARHSQRNKLVVACRRQAIWLSPSRSL